MYYGRRTIAEIMYGVVVKPGTKPRKVANNTVRYIRPDGSEVIRLHRTDIVVKRLDGSCVLNSDGWHTTTTKDRMNTFSPVRLFQRKHKWFVMRDPSAREWDDIMPYEDHMIIDPYGRPLGIE